MVQEILVAQVITFGSIARFRIPQNSAKKIAIIIF